MQNGKVVLNESHYKMAARALGMSNNIYLPPSFYRNYHMGGGGKLNLYDDFIKLGYAICCSSSTIDNQSKLIAFTDAGKDWFRSEFLKHHPRGYYDELACELSNTERKQLKLHIQKISHELLEVIEEQKNSEDISEKAYEFLNNHLVTLHDLIENTMNDAVKQVMQWNSSDSKTI